MGHQIIRQPNHKFGIWSSIVDDFVLVNATREDIIQYYIDSACTPRWTPWTAAKGHTPNSRSRSGRQSIGSEKYTAKNAVKNGRRRWYVVENNLHRMWPGRKPRLQRQLQRCVGGPFQVHDGGRRAGNGRAVGRLQEDSLLRRERRKRAEHLARAAGVDPYQAEAQACRAEETT